MKQVENKVLYKVTFDLKKFDLTIISPYVTFENQNIILFDITDDETYEFPIYAIANLKIKEIKWKE